MSPKDTKCKLIELTGPQRETRRYDLSLGVDAWLSCEACEVCAVLTRELLAMLAEFKCLF